MTPTHCISCGSEVPDHAKFCHACGSAVYRPEDTSQHSEPFEAEPSVEQPPEPAPAESPVPEASTDPTDEVTPELDEPEPAVEQPPEPAPAEAPVSETINEPTDEVTPEPADPNVEGTRRHPKPISPETVKILAERHKTTIAAMTQTVEEIGYEVIQPEQPAATKEEAAGTQPSQEEVFVEPSLTSVQPFGLRVKEASGDISDWAARAVRKDAANYTGSQEDLTEREIIDRLTNYLHVPVAMKGYRQRKRAGGALARLYSEDAQVIRMQEFKKLDEVAIQIGHHVAKQLLGVKYNPKAAGELEMLGLGTSPDNATGQYLREEGEAQFFAMWALDSDRAKALAPTHFAAFQRKLNAIKDTELGKQLRTFSFVMKGGQLNESQLPAQRSANPKISPETPSTEAPGEGEPVARPEFYHFGLTEDYSYFFLVGWVIFPLTVGAFFSAFGAGIGGFVFGAAATLAIYYIFTSRQRRWAAARATYSRFVKAHYTHPYKKSKWETSEQARARAEAENLGDDKWSECSDAVRHFNRGITFWNAAETVDEFLAKANGEFRRSLGCDSERTQVWYWVAATADPSDAEYIRAGYSSYLGRAPNGRYADHARRVLQVMQEGRWRTS